MRDLFSEKGEITDVQLKFTKDGVFRKFGFVGFSNDNEAAQAIEHFHNTCIDTSRIAVELCASLGSEAKPQSWSKYAADSTTFKKLHGIHEKEVQEREAAKAEVVKKNKQQRLDDILGDHKSDPKFLEFMKVHGKGADVWDNDLGLAKQTETLPESNKLKKAPQPIPSGSVESEDDANASDEDEGSGEDGEGEEEGNGEVDGVKLADQAISDTDYLKSLMNKEPKPAQKKAKKEENQIGDLFTVKIREIPFKTKRQDIIKFFRPVKAFSIRLPTRKHGFCYVGFKTEKEFTKAMLKNRSFLNGKQVILIDFTEKNNEATRKKKDDPVAPTDESKKNPKWAKQEEGIKNEEDISESGRIFFRNLSYTVTEDQLQELFQSYGPIADISLPIDVVTRRIKGFGTVTFVMPEHALKAFSELDGSTFQGRLLHLIPGKSRDEEETNTDGMSYKKKKELEQKKTAGSSHNWNTLFIGANAVVNAMAKNYKASKEQVLDTATGGSSAAVRLALGETEMILDMRRFLESNDVVLDAFNGVPTKRSKRVILAKNLPAETTVEDLQPMFAKFGLLGRIVLPPSGVTAIVEFLDSSEAKKSFSKLAYTKFKNLPLYLEWAPENTFKSESTKPMENFVDVKTKAADKSEPSSSQPNPFTKDAKNKHATRVPEMKATGENEYEQFVINENDHSENDNKEAVEEEDEEDDTEPEEGTTLFLRNLKFATQVETLRKHFAHIGKIHHVQVAMKKDPDNPRNKIPLGYGFIQFKQKNAAEKALKTMLTTHIDGNAVELKRSDRTLQ